MAVAGRMAVGNAESGQHLFRRQPQQLARRRGGAEDAHGRRAVPAAIHRAGERDAARYVEPQRNRQQQLLAGDAAEAVAHGQSRAQHRDAGMDRAAGVERVVEIQRMPHAGVQQRRLRRRQADAAQQHAAFGQPAPARDHREELVDPRRTAAAEHAAEGVENVAAGGLDGARRQIRIARAANVLGQRPSGIIGHRLLFHRFRCCDITRPGGP